MSTAAERIYQELDQFTDGIEEFMAAGRDETWTSNIYVPLSVTWFSGRTVHVALNTEVNGDIVDDPGITVTLGDREADLSTMEMRTLMGAVLGMENVPDLEANGEYLAELLHEMNLRKGKSMHLSNRVEYAT